MNDLPLVDALRNELSHTKIVTPDSPIYHQSIERWSDSSVKNAAIVVYPKSANEVSVTLKLANKHGMDIAVSGGQHSTAGDSSIEGGLVIDLAEMRDVRVDPTAKTITAGGGCLWKDVDEAGAKHGLATVGGTVNHTGIGGLTLGGGFGYLSGQYGMTVDNLLSVEMVLADGTILTASKAEHPDLFWAVRGAGHSFGVVTSFVYRGHTLDHTVFAGIIVWSVAFAPLLVKFCNSLVAPGSDGRTTIHALILSPPEANGQTHLGAMVFHDGPEAEARERLKPLLDSEILMSTAQQRPYEEVNGILAAGAPRGGRKTSKGASFNAPVSLEHFMQLVAVYDKFPKGGSTGVTCTVLLEFIPPWNICRPGVDDMAVPHRSQRLQGSVQLVWRTPGMDAKCREWAREIGAAIRNLGRVDSDTCEYVNYDGTGLSPKVVFGQHYERLAQLKLQYDPKNAFKKRIGLRV